MEEKIELLRKDKEIPSFGQIMSCLLKIFCLNHDMEFSGFHGNIIQNNDDDDDDNLKLRKV